MAGLDSLLRCSESLQVLTVAVLVMAFLVLALIVLTIGHKALLDRRSKRMERHRVRYHARMKEALRDPSATIDTPRTSVEADALCDVIVEMLDEASADEADRLRKRARELGLDTRHKRLACSHSYVKRFSAIERLGFLKLPDTKYFLLSLLGREGNREVVARIVLALTFIVDEEEDLAIINQVLKSPSLKSSKFNEYVYCNIIRSLREAGKEQVFVEFLESLPDAAMPVALKKDIIEAYRLEDVCGCPTEFGAPPNTQVCPTCLGLPGSLPAVNAMAVASAIRIGLALKCSIAEWSRFARKNYFYPDMPKDFQTSQYDEPIATDGWLDVEAEGQVFRIGIERAHMEEDTGKNTHVGGATGRIHGADYSLVDYNRAGVPLIEIVTKPIEVPPELAPVVARAYVTELRELIVALTKSGLISSPAPISRSS